MSFIKVPYRKPTGFSLIEAIAGLAILLILLAGSTNGFLRLTQDNRRNQVRGDAIAAGRRVIDGYRLQNISELPPTASDPDRIVNSTEEVNGETFNVRTTFCPTDAAIDFCTSNTRRHIRVEVFYPADNNRIYYSTETVFSELN